MRAARRALLGGALLACAACGSRTDQLSQPAAPPSDPESSVTSEPTQAPSPTPPETAPPQSTPTPVQPTTHRPAPAPATSPAVAVRTAAPSVTTPEALPPVPEECELHHLDLRAIRLDPSNRVDASTLPDKIRRLQRTHDSESYIARIDHAALVAAADRNTSWNLPGDVYLVVSHAELTGGQSVSSTTGEYIGGGPQPTLPEPAPDNFEVDVWSIDKGFEVTAYYAHLPDPCIRP